MANLCIIPARGGSKRIPRKNIRDFMGKPMIAYPILCAINSGLFDEVMVSTEDPEIENIAKKWGASVPFTRTDQLSNDFATTADVIMEVVNMYLSHGREFESVCCLYPCTPLLEESHLINAFDVLKKENKDVVLPIVSFDFPIQRALSINGQNVRFMYEEYSLARSQDLEKSYHDAGQFYWLKVHTFLKTGKILGDNTGFIILDKMECHDIDTETDWKMAGIKFKIKNGIE